MTNDKRVLREGLLARRMDISIIENAELSARACQRLLRLPEYKRVGTVMCYISIKNEVETRGFIRQALRDGKRICLPRVDGDGLLAVIYTEQSELIRRSFGTYEVASGEILSPEEIGLAVVPGVGFDRQGGRLGYGKGYYDRYLADFRGLKVGLAFHVQLVDSVLYTERDVKMDLIVTDQETIVCGNSTGGADK